MLGPDVFVIEPPRLLVGEGHHLASSVGQTFEHGLLRMGRGIRPVLDILRHGKVACSRSFEVARDMPERASSLSSDPRKGESNLPPRIAAMNQNPRFDRIVRGHGRPPCHPGRPNRTRLQPCRSSRRGGSAHGSVPADRGRAGPGRPGGLVPGATGPRRGWSGRSVRVGAPGWIRARWPVPGIVDPRVDVDPASRSTESRSTPPRSSGDGSGSSRDGLSRRRTRFHLGRRDRPAGPRRGLGPRGPAVVRSPGGDRRAGGRGTPATRGSSAGRGSGRHGVRPSAPACR